MIKKISLSILMLSLIPLLLPGQSKMLEKAIAAENKNDLMSAIAYYKEAIAVEPADSVKRQLSYRIALNYLDMQQYQTSFPWFEDAVGKQASDPGIYLHYGDALARAGRLNKALHIYEKAAELKGYGQEVTTRIRSAELALKVMDMPDGFNIQRDEILNSEFRDFAPAWFEGQLVFSSSRISKKRERIDATTGQPYADLYIASFNESNADWGLPVEMKKPFRIRYNKPAFAYNPVTEEAYCMQYDKYSRKGNILKARYYKANNKWLRFQKLDFNAAAYSVGYPALSANGQLMYFASDMSGGSGGFDIWKAYKKIDGSWGLPINAGENINSSGDEIYPFLLADSILFFASDGREGLGALDIFYSIQKEFEFTEAVNLGHPFNSAANDYAMIINKDLDGGLFCTNRENEYSDDIYTFEHFPLMENLSGTVWDMVTKTPLEKANVTIIRQDEEINLQTDEKGKFEYFGLIPDASYEIRVSKENYYPESKQLLIDQLVQRDVSNNVQLVFKLSKLEYPLAIKGRVLDRADKLPMRGILVEIRGPGDYQTLAYTDEAGYYSFSDLKPGKSYNLKVSKEGYFSESRDIELPDAKEPMSLSSANGYDTDFLMTRIEKKKEIALNEIYYDFDKASLRPESLKELNKLASMLKETPEVVIQISSHTDTQGAEWYNQQLSEKRAQTVVNALIERGISKDRLIAKGYGESRPLIPGASNEAEHQQNRRTTFKVLEVKSSRMKKRKKTRKQSTMISATGSS
ncbi:MAG: OmpA family protein [Bacteroidota bacterium]|nr:OmpA family protein [Bacteroidota bacterium]